MPEIRDATNAFDMPAYLADAGQALRQLIFYSRMPPRRRYALTQADADIC